MLIDFIQDEVASPSSPSYLPVGDEHWYLGPIFAGIEDLVGLKQSTVKSLHFNLPKHLEVGIRRTWITSHKKLMRLWYASASFLDPCPPFCPLLYSKVGEDLVSYPTWARQTERTWYLIPLERDRLFINYMLDTLHAWWLPPPLMINHLVLFIMSWVPCTNGQLNPGYHDTLSTKPQIMIQL